MKNKISIKHLIEIINLGAKNCPVGRNGLSKSCLKDNVCTKLRLATRRPAEGEKPQGPEAVHCSFGRRAEASQAEDRHRRLCRHRQVLHHQEVLREEVRGQVHADDWDRLWRHQDICRQAGGTEMEDQIDCFTASWCPTPTSPKVKLCS